MGNEPSTKFAENWNVSMNTIGAIYSLIFVIIFIKNFMTKSQESKSIHLILWLSAMLHVTSWLIHFTCAIITFINSHNHLDNKNNIPNYIICFMIILHPIGVYTFITARIYFSFRSSMVARLKSTELGLIILGVCAVVVVRFLEQMSWVLVIAKKNPIIHLEKIIITLWVFIGMDIFMRIVLVFVFCWKLLKILLHLGRLDTKVTSKIDAKTNKPRETIQISLQSFQFINVMKKVTLLGIVAVVPMAVQRIAFVITFESVNGKLTPADWMAFNFLTMIGIFIEIFAILLSFPFSKRAYRVFCLCCDTACNQCCHVGVKYEFSKSFEKSSTTTGIDKSRSNALSSPSSIKPDIMDNDIKQTQLTRNITNEDNDVGIVFQNSPQNTKTIT